MRTGICFTLLLLSLYSVAQEPEFSRLGVNEGLSQNSVYGLLQDKQGFLWIGTGDGLNRYDGKNFVQYRGSYNDTSGAGLSARIITGRIAEDSKERLWFGSNNGLILFDKRTQIFTDPVNFNPSLKKFNTGIRVIGIDRNDHVWLHNDNNDLFVLDPSKWSLQVMIAATSKGEINNAGELSGDHFYYLRKDGLYSFNINGQQHRKILQIQSPSLLKKTMAGKVIVHTRKSFIVYDPRNNSAKKYTIPGNLKRTLSVMQEWPEGIFYLNASPEGIARFDIHKNELVFLRNQPADPSSLSSDLVLDGYLDKTLNLWIATEGGGLNRLDLKPSRFQNFPSYAFNRNEAANLMVKSIFRCGNNILIGTFSQGLYVLDEVSGNSRQIRFPQLEPLVSPPSINTIYKDHKGNLWMNFGRAIGILDTTTFNFRLLSFIKDEEKIPRGNFAVYSMAEYYPGRFILGSNYGLHRMDYINGKVETFNVPADTLYRGHNQGMVVMPDGTIMLGRIRDGFVRLHIKPDGTLSEIDAGYKNTGIRHFYNDSTRKITWMASENGLIAHDLENKTYRFYDEQNGMSNSYVYSIIPENDSVLWLSTNRGLNKVSLLDRNKFPEIRVTPYLQVHGLQSNEFNSGAFHKDDKGRIYFGGVNGINWFSPGQVINLYFNPRLSLTGMRINEKAYSGSVPVNYLQSLSLPHNRNTISFSFSALEFSNSAGHVYSYILEGFDNDWVYAGDIPEARYSNLPPGNYIFKVKAGSGDGAWIEKPLQLSISITPPFWQTWWFKLLVWLTIGIVIIVAVRSYIRSRVQKRIRELEKEHAINQERVRISKDMHDELGTGLTKISLLTALGKQRSDKEHLIEEVYSTSRKLTEKMGEIIWTLSPQNDTLDSLVAYLKEHFSDTTESLDIKSIADIPAEIPAKKISYKKKQHLMLVCKEALHNAIKHSGATLITFRVSLTDHVIHFSISDNGKGIKTAVNPSNGKRNGIGNMQWRMSEAGGTFAIRDNPGNGTIISWSIPV